MSLQAPGLIDGEAAVDPDQARTEILAQAFSDVASGYFERKTRYEDNIEDDEATISRMKQLAIGGVVAGVLLIGAEFGLDGTSGLVAGLGVVVGFVSAYYAYRKINAARDRIEDYEANLAADEPDGSVSFVSQIGVPLYLVPYQDRFMIFDGLDMASRTTLRLANLDEEALGTTRGALEDLEDIYDEYLAGQSVISPDYAEQLSPGVTTHRQLERPILEQIDRMTDIARDVERETIEVSVHANNWTAMSVRQLAQQDLLRSNGDLSLIETSHSMAESEAIVDEIRGVEELAVSGDLLDQAKDHRRYVNEFSTGLAERLQENSQVVSEHFDAYSACVDTAMHKSVCAACLDDRVDDIDSRLNLVDEILGREGGSLGAALGDEDLDRGYDGSFTQEVRDDLHANIPKLSDELKEAYHNLDDIGDSGYCELHEDVDTVTVAESGQLFGEVWRSLYFAFREPINDSIENLESEAEQARENKEQKRIDLTQYEQIKDDVEQRYHQAKADYETARAIESRLG